MSPQDRPVFIPAPSLTEAQAKALRERFKAKTTGDALAAMALALAGIWALGVLVEKSEKKPKRRKA